MIKKLLAVFLITAGIGAAMYVYYALNIWPEEIASYLKCEAEKNGFALVIEDPSLSLAAFSARKAALRPKRSPLGIELQNPRISVALIDLLSLTLSANVTAELYDGTLKGTATGKNLFSLYNISFRANGVNIGDHPLLTSLAVVGKLTVKGENILFDPSRGLIEGKADIVLKDVNKRLGSVFPAYLTGLRKTIRIPPFSKLNAQMSLTVDPDGIRIPSFTLDSSLGHMRGQGSLSPSEHGLPGELTIKSIIRLSNSGRKELGESWEGYETTPLVWHLKIKGFLGFCAGNC